MANLRLDNIYKRYSKGVMAVKGVSLSINDGEFLVLLGPSGCGKTTILRMIAGLEEVTKGNIFMDDVDITMLPPWRRNMSMIFQSYAVWPHMTVYQNIAYALRLKKMSPSEIDRIVKDVADMTDITKYLDRYPNQLSGGQRQRVAVARAVAVKPKIFLMDEPLSNLDAKLRVSMRTELKAIHLKTGATTIFVTHDQSEAMSLADRIVIMRDGKIIQIGTPEDVYHDSANMFVANFIGTPPTNFIKVKVSVREREIILFNEDFKIIYSKESAPGLIPYDESDIILGIRPENITITKENDALLKTECLLVEPQGSYNIIVTKIVGKIVKIVVPSEIKIRPGETFYIKFKKDTILFFDPKTEERIREEKIS